MKAAVLAILVLTTTAQAQPYAYPPPPPLPEPQLGTTFEASFGLGALQFPGADRMPIGAGPALGLARFIAPELAAGVRLGGFSWADGGGFLVLGTITPNAQLWLGDQMFVGAGVGLGLVVACGEGCGGADGLALNARLGFAFRPRGRSGGNLALEATSLKVGGDSISSVAAMFGVQAF